MSHCSLMASTQCRDESLSPLWSTNAAVLNQWQPWAHPYQGRLFPLDKESGTGLRGTPGLGRGSSQKQWCSGFFTASQLVCWKMGGIRWRNAATSREKDKSLESRSLNSNIQIEREPLALSPEAMALESWSLGRCGVCPYVLKAWITSAHVLLAGAFSVVWLGCALTGLGLRDMRFSTALTYKYSRNLRKKFQVLFHASVLLAAFPFYLVSRI